jgi:hypothetical protein
MSSAEPIGNLIAESQFVALRQIKARQRPRSQFSPLTEERTMNPLRSFVIATTLIATVPALGQSPQDHEAHHPDASAGAQTQAPQPAPPQAETSRLGTTGPGMMGGSMMGDGNMMSQGEIGSRGMMPMMNQMMRGQAGAEHIEGRLAFIKAEIKITDIQSPQWTTFVEAVRNNANSMSEMRKAMMSQQGAPAALPDRLALEEKLVTAHLAALKGIEEAASKLYGVLSDEQKKIADSIIIGPMGVPMGMM